MDSLKFSADAIGARSRLYNTGEGIVLYVEDTDKEYLYETLFKRILGNEYCFKKICACGGKSNVINFFQENNSLDINDKNLYLVDGDFDRLIHSEMMIHNPRFIYLDYYNIEDYLIDEYAIEHVMKNYFHCIDEQVKEIIDFNNWKKRIINESSELFLLYCVAQTCDTVIENVNTNPYQIIDSTTGFFKTDVNPIASYRCKLQSVCSDIDTRMQSVQQKYTEIYSNSDDYLHIICGKFLLTSLFCYLRKKLKKYHINLITEVLIGSFASNVELSKFDSIKGQIISAIHGSCLSNSESLII